MTIRTGSGRTGGIGGRLIIGIIAALVAIVGYFGARQINPVTQETQHISMTTEQEIALGKQAAPEMETQFGGLSQDAALQAKVSDIGNAGGQSLGRRQVAVTSTSSMCWLTRRP